MVSEIELETDAETDTDISATSSNIIFSDISAPIVADISLVTDSVPDCDTPTATFFVNAPEPEATKLHFPIAGPAKLWLMMIDAVRSYVSSRVMHVLGESNEV